jgi:two-component system nitrogen regulation sensor histidine kinase NtrY
MASDTIHPPLLPIAWRTALVLGLGALTAHLMATTQYYATIFILLALSASLVFGVARQLLQSQSLQDNAAANRAIANLQTAQKRAAQEQDHLRALLDTVSAALLVMDGDGGTAPVNRAAQLLTRGEGPHLSNMVAIGVAAAQQVEALAPGTRAVLRLANGQQTLVSATQFTDADGRARRLVSLQNVVGELDAVQLKAWQDMTRVLAHEMMNSLTPIASLSESLSGMIRSQGVGGDAVEAADTIARRSQGLAGFIERYRQLAELPRPRLKVFSARDFMAELDRLMSAALSGTAYRSITDDGLQLIADPDLLSQAMINLLNNAVDAVAGIEGATVTVSCGQDENGTVLAVADNGPGVSQERKEEIFVPFFTTKTKGSGIGLSLARQIALAHGGRIEVVKNSPRGAIFRILLPRPERHI